MPSEQGSFVLLLVKSGQAELTVILPSVTHRWYMLGSEIKLCLDSLFPLWYSAPYRCEAVAAGACTGRQEPVCCREGPARHCTVAAGLELELRKGEFFLKGCSLSPATRSTRPGLAGDCCPRHAVAELLLGGSWFVKPPQRCGLAAESPCGGKKPGKGKRNCCNGSLEAGWLLMRPSLW